MMKILAHFLILAGILTGIFLGLQQIDFVKRAELDKLGERNAKRLGKVLLNSVLSTKQEVDSPEARAFIDSLKRPLCQASGLNPDSISIHLIRDEEVNAFALPGNQIILNTGLFRFAENPEEVAGVLGHELGHIKLDHLERKMIKEVGLTILFTAAGGEGGQVLVKELLKMLSSSSFDREYEDEADAFAVTTMAKAGADPAYLSSFMLRISREQNMPDELVFLSTHPDSKSRAANIVTLASKEKVNPAKLIRTPWSDVQAIAR